MKIPSLILHVFVAIFFPLQVSIDLGENPITCREGIYSDNAEISLDVPYSFILNQNYPNPFYPLTVISYQLPFSSAVTLKVFDILGNEISILVNGTKQAGIHEITFDASPFPSGIYFYQMNAGNLLLTRKFSILTLVRSLLLPPVYL